MKNSIEKQQQLFCFYNEKQSEGQTIRPKISIN